MREVTVCFSGHRPEKLPGIADGNERLLRMIKSMLYYQIRLAISEGYTDFISGLARGVDLWAAEYVLQLRQEYPHLRLCCVKPMPQHGSGFSGEDRYLLQTVLAHADALICTSNGYTRDCYQKRNHYMVEHANRLIAVVDDFKSGTGQTIRYAQKEGLELHVIEVQKIKQALAQSLQ